MNYTVECPYCEKDKLPMLDKKVPMPPVKKPKEIYIIQTNTSLDDNGVSQDFQSRVYGYAESWEEFKKHLLSSEPDTEKIVGGTMMGTTKPAISKIEKVLINDDRHIEIIINTANGKFNSKYFLVTVEQFRNI